MSDSRRLREFSDVVGRIYEASADISLWPKVIGLMCERFSACSGAIHFHKLGESGALFTVACSADGVRSRLYMQSEAWMMPFAQRLCSGVAGAVVCLRDVHAAAEYHDSRFYRDWVEPRGNGDLMAAVIYRDERHLVFVCLARRSTDGPYERAAIDGFRLVGQHLQRAALLCSLIEQHKVEATVFEKLVGRLAAAVIIVDDACTVTFINPSARRLLDEDGVGCIVNGRLTLFAVPVSTVTRGVRENQTYVAALSRTGADAGPLALTAFALRGGERPELRNLIAILISGERTAGKPPRKLLAKLYGLSVAELRVLSELLAGNNPDRIAQQLGISLTTVRTHLARLFEKTGSSGQVDLMRKVGSVFPPVSTPADGP